MYDIHLVITKQCNRNCKYCCNKEYDLDNLPKATEEEFKNARYVLLTGGEPVLYSSFYVCAFDLKEKYPNIEKIILYANAFELSIFLNRKNSEEYFKYIDGLSISIKNERDRIAFMEIIKENLMPSNCTSNRLYVFDNLIPDIKHNIEIVNRKWQKNFKPADNCIFRRCADLIR